MINRWGVAGVTLLAGVVVSLFSTMVMANATVIFQVRTNAEPGTEFHRIRTQFTTVMPRSVPLAENIVFAKSRSNWGRGVRVAEFGPFGNGTYRGSVAMLNYRGEVVVERPVRVTLKDGVRVVTVLLVPPQKASVDRCHSHWRQQNRSCGLELKTCIAKLQGDRSKLGQCQLAHRTCEQKATAQRDRCSKSNVPGRRVLEQRQKPMAAPR